MLIEKIVVSLTVLKIHVVELSVKKTIGLDFLGVIFIFLVDYGRNQLILYFLALGRQAQLLIKKVRLSIYAALQPIKSQLGVVIVAAHLELKIKIKFLRLQTSPKWQNGTPILSYQLTCHKNLRLQYEMILDQTTQSLDYHYTLFDYCWYFDHLAAHYLILVSQYIFLKQFLPVKD